MAISLPFFDDFNRADGPLGVPWIGATWTVESNEAKNTPTLGSEEYTNEDLEDWDDAETPTWWNHSHAGTSTVNREGVEQHGGTYCVRFDIDASNSVAQITKGIDVGDANEWLLVTHWAKSSIAGKTGAFNRFGWEGNNINRTLTTDWVQYFEGGRARLDPAPNYFKSVIAPSSSLYWDDVSLKVLTLSTLFGSLQTTVSANIVAGVDVTLAHIGVPSGLVICLDDTGTPANFVIGYHNGYEIFLEKCVAGTYTTLIQSVTAYTPGATIQIVKSGTQVELWYDGNKIGATQTVSDVGIVDNTLHGLFSIYSENTLDNYSLIELFDESVSLARLASMMSYSQEIVNEVTNLSSFYGLGAAAQKIDNESVIFSSFYGLSVAELFEISELVALTRTNSVFLIDNAILFNNISLLKVSAMLAELPLLYIFAKGDNAFGIFYRDKRA